MLDCTQKESEIILTDYQSNLIADFMKRAKISDLKDKVILEIGSDLKLMVAKKFVELGAKEVVCVNPVFSKELLSTHFDKIKLVKNCAEKINFPKNYFDCIFGIAILEHVIDVKTLFNEVKRMLKKNGISYLQGGPMYTSACGHHTWSLTPEVFYKFSDTTNPFKPWEHLILHTRSEYEKNLENKNIPIEHIKSILDVILSDRVSKGIPSTIVKNARKVFGNKMSVIRANDYEIHNEYYEKAKEQYSEEDLNTRSLILFISPANNKFTSFIKKLIRTIKLIKLICQY